MVATIDRDKVRGSFHRHAGEYDRHAQVQPRVVDRIAAMVDAEALHPGRLLDVGSGTGKLLGRLAELYPDALAVGADLAFGMCQTALAALAHRRVNLVNADAERLPFATASFDLAVSTSTFQWLSTLDGAFTEMNRVLLPGGLFCFALFGEKTLFELRESYRASLTGGPDRSLDFFTTEDVRSALEKAGFSAVNVFSDLEVERHADVPDLLRSIKRIGANTTAPVARKGLSERRVMLEMMETYRRKFGDESGIPATYEVIYGIGRKTG
ncbi:malonyl-[acyl-carrier protein] O-methyltransferase [Geomonas sp. Red276]